MSNKYVYPSVSSLLEEKNPKLYLKFKTLTSNENALVLYDFESVNNTENEPSFVAETDIYKMSRVFKSLQYMSNSNVIRIWDEDLLSNITKINCIENTNDPY